MFITLSCQKDEPTAITCNVSYTISQMPLSEGDHLQITDFKITPVPASLEITVSKVEFFLGNRLMGSVDRPPYELDYELPTLPDGEHLLQIDVFLKADGYDDTTIWIKQNVSIQNTLNDE